jgi:hypothetical protein
MSARALLLASAAASASVFAFACGAPSSDESASQNDAVTTVAKINPEWKGPAPGSKDNDLDEKGVLAAWKKMKETFYDNPGLSRFDGSGNPIPMALTDFRYPKPTEWAQCMNNKVPNWSDLMMHFYCSMPSYATVTPNIRGCFSYVAPNLQGPPPVNGVAQPGFEQRRIFYPEIYDFCLFQPYDYARAQSHGAADPVFDTAEIDKNKAAGNKVGVLKWVDDNIQDAFKHVVFTWYEPGTYKFEQQQNVINAFYGVKLKNKAYGANDKADIAECNAKRPPSSADSVGGVPDGVQCSTAKSQTGFVSGELATGTDAQKAYSARLNYMKTSVTTHPYTPSKI